MSRNSNWNERQLTLALALYYRVPATKISGTNPMLKDASAYIGRSSSAIAFKLANFRAIDRNAGEGPRGFSHGSRTDTEVMERFLDPDSGSVDLEKLSDAVQSIFGAVCSPVDKSHALEVILGVDILPEIRKTEAVSIVKRRVGQGYFRNAVLANCGNTCLISHCRTPELLEAAHIVSWSAGEADRLTIGNGIALNPFFHEAYDKNFMGISPDGTVEFAESLKQRSTEFWDNFLEPLEGIKIDLDTRTPINKEFLSLHYQEFRAGKFDVGF